ncbi:hypothetical protein HDU76_000724 [Blyttiomyces sp. JEL0837]|nr:hypothetical protein HDU76_000724 [Blyttiomyces sp. JEL0837]
MSVLPVETIHGCMVKINKSISNSQVQLLFVLKQSITESIGLNLKDSVANALLADVEYRLREIIYEARKFMIHSKRNTLQTDDVNHALRVKNVEPLYGYTSSGSARFKMVPQGTQRLYYLEDHEVDLDEIIYGTLPPVPLDVSITAHWLAIDGVQPAIVQNPSPADLKAAAAEAELAAQAKSSVGNEAPVPSGPDGIVNGEVLVKHVLSKELQMYHDKITESVLSQTDELRNMAINSLSMDPGIQPLMPYFIQFIAHQVTKNVRNLSILWSMMRMTRAILNNPNLFIEPYLHQIIPHVLTCLVSKRIGEPGDDHHALRDFSAKISAYICSTFGLTYPTIEPRVTKTLLRAFLDPQKTLSTHYGAIVGLAALGREVIKILIIPNVRAYVEATLAADLREGPGTDASPKYAEAKKCYDALLDIVCKHVSVLLDEKIALKQALPSTEDFRQQLEQEYGLMAKDVYMAVSSKLQANSNEMAWEQTSTSNYLT